MRQLRNDMVVALVLGALLTVDGEAAFAADRPNILLILADDMGYGDMGWSGSRRLQTPHLDALAASGVVFSQAYVASPVCSPSRAGLLTGRDPRRFGYEANLNDAAARYPTRPALLGLAPTERTLADHLKAAGFATALVGKWHLGVGPPFHPNRRGFDHFCGFLGGWHDYFPTADDNRLERNRRPLRSFSSPYLTDFFTDEALRWLSHRHRQRPRQPWFLYLSYNAPHTPMQATEDDLAAFSHVGDERRRTYAAMVRALDRGVGRVIARLEEHGEREDTLIVFLSDNGGATDNGSWNGPLSGAKGSLREGGVRVPMIWSWPGRLPAGSRFEGVASSLDLLPSFLGAAGAQPLPLLPPPSHEDAGNRGRGIERYGSHDGLDLLPYLRDAKAPQARLLFWRLQGQAAVLRGPDKAIRLSHRPPQLFQPDRDPGEGHDRALESPERLVSLLGELAEWEAALPTAPLWESSPFWLGDSARIYDTWRPKPEPE